MVFWLCLCMFSFIVKFVICNFKVFFFFLDILPKIFENYRKFPRITKNNWFTENPKTELIRNITEKSETEIFWFWIGWQFSIRNIFGFGLVRPKTDPIRPTGSPNSKYVFQWSSSHWLISRSEAIISFLAIQISSTCMPIEVLEREAKHACVC